MIDINRLKEGASAYGLSLSDTQLAAFDRYAELLAAWNEKINLTAITDPEGILVKHFLDSLSGVNVFGNLKPGTQVLDVGTGGGLPGMALAIVFPEADFTLMDATGKKVKFLQMVADELQLENVKALQGRAEEKAHEEMYREQFDLVTSRAVAAMNVLLEYTVGFVKEEGRIAAYKGPSVEEELAEAAHAVKVLGLSVGEVQEVRIGEYAHTIAMFHKVKLLAPKYPRPHAQIRKKAL